MEEQNTGNCSNVGEHTKTLSGEFQEEESYILKKYCSPCHDIQKLDAATELVTINVLAVVDYSAYCHFLTKEENKDSGEAISDVESYIKEVFKEVDAYFGTIDSNKYRYKINVTELMNLMDSEESWLKNAKHNNSMLSDKVCYVEYLKSLKCLTTSRHFDVAIAFTNLLDLMFLGLTYLGRIGTKDAVGVVKMDKISETSSMVADEVAHILGEMHNNMYMGNIVGIVENFNCSSDGDQKFSSISISEMSKGVDILKKLRSPPKTLGEFHQEGTYIFKKYCEPCLELQRLDAATELVTINVLAVVDYSCYYSCLCVTGEPKSTNSVLEWYVKDVFRRLNSYYGAIASNKYRYKINVSELMILTDPKVLDVSEENRDKPLQSHEEYYYAEYLTSMIQLSTGRNFDAILSFTSKEDKNCLGMASIGRIGTNFAIGVVKCDEDMALTSSVAAHELAHILGADHDECGLGDYINVMDVSIATYREVENYKFSNLSIDSMAKGVDFLLGQRSHI